MTAPVTPLPPATVTPSMLRRVRDLLPRGWFPEPGDELGATDTPEPVLEAYLAGWANGIAGWIWWFLQYVTAQLYITTATGGWLDIASTDYLGPSLPRLPGELDDPFRLRIQQNLFPPANTRSAIQAAVATLTGAPVRMIEPWDPRDNACYGYAFYGVDATARPGNYSNGNARYQGFVECSLPAVKSLGAQPQWSFYDGGFYGNNSGFAGWYWDGPTAGGSGAQLVYGLVNRLKSEGTTVWVRFLNPVNVTEQLAYDFLIDGSLRPLDDSGGRPLTP
ncbi:MAG TPA: hypothetical protein VFA12_20065 [Stellaceae bacterium]|nr:hypothetical protein [Stellaceae bacterium]